MHGFALSFSAVLLCRQNVCSATIVYHHSFGMCQFLSCFRFHNSSSNGSRIRFYPRSYFGLIAANTTLHRLNLKLPDIDKGDLHGGPKSQSLPNNQ